MTDFPLLTTLVVVPAVGGLVVAAVPRTRGELAKQIGLAISLATLVLTGVVATQFSTSGDTFQLNESYDWIAAFGVHWALGVDGIGLVLIAMTAVLMPVVLLAAWHDTDDVVDRAGNPRGASGYVALMLLLEAMVIGAFAATDVFMFYVFFEAMLVPMYFIVGGYGGARRSYAAVKFLLYNLLGGLIMLAAVVGLFMISSRTGPASFSLAALQQLDISVEAQRWLFLGFFIAFAIKAPMWPFHTWLPDAATESTPAGAVVMVGLMDKLGTFGMIRFCLTLFPDGARYFTPVIIVCAVIGVLYAALVAIGQTDIQRLAAYTSVSHFGFIILGIFALTSTSQSGSTLLMLNHGFATAGLFLVVGFMIKRRGSRRIADFGGMQKVAPVLAGSLLFAGLATLALPGLSTFVSEFLVLLGSFQTYRAAAIIATLGIVLAAVYVLLMYQRTMTGPVGAGVDGLPDLNLREKIVVAPIVAVVVALGFFPGPVLDVINPAVHSIMELAGATDPQHPVPAAAEPN